MSTTRTAAAVTAAILTAGAAGFGAAHATTDSPPARDLRAARYTATTLRLAGADRYDTAVQISRDVWDRDGAEVVYLATGTSYPDALAMGASTILRGPILFVKQDSIPNGAREELSRLLPCQVVAVGGVGVVSEAVLADAGAYTSLQQAKCS